MPTPAVGSGAKCGDVGLFDRTRFELRNEALRACRANKNGTRPENKEKKEQWRNKKRERALSSDDTRTRYLCSIERTTSCLVAAFIQGYHSTSEIDLRNRTKTAIPKTEKMPYSTDGGRERSAKTVEFSASGGGSTIGTRTTEEDAVAVAVAVAVTVTTTLPPTLWARSFDFLPYSDVRSGRFVCKLLCREVPRHVETLSILKCAEMDVPNARLYPNVRNLNVLCLVNHLYPDRWHLFTLAYNVEAFQKVVNFLQAFYRLEKVFLGGWGKVGKFSFLADGIPKDNKPVILNLLGSLCNAFQMRALPKDIDLECMEHRPYLLCHCLEQGPDDDDDGKDNCQLCKKIFSCFPFRLCYELNCSCTYQERFEIMAKRPDMKEKLMSPEVMADALPRMHCSFEGEHLPADTLMTKIHGSTSFVGAEHGIVAFFFEMQCLRQIKATIDFGNDPRKVDMTAVLERICQSCREIGIKRPALGALYVVIFIKLGFRIPTNDVLILDEETCPRHLEYEDIIYCGEYQDLVAFREELGS